MEKRKHTIQKVQKKYSWKLLMDLYHYTNQVRLEDLSERYGVSRGTLISIKNDLFPIK